MTRQSCIELRCLARGSRRLAPSDERGVSAVEFAMLLPLMLTLYLGGVEISQGVGIDRKVTLTARTVADLVSQVSSINNADMTNVLNAAAAVMAPFPVDKLKVTVSVVKIDANGNATVDWSDTLNGTARANGLDGDAAGRAQRPEYVADLERGAVQLQAAIGYVVTGTLKLNDQIYMRPRLSDTVTRIATLTRHCDAGHGIGSAVVDLIFSIAKRDVTFFSGTRAISFL